MRLECTKKLLDYLDVKPEKAAEPVEPVFQWSADLIVVKRRKTMVVTHAASRSMFVIHGLTAKVRAKLPELIMEGIRILLRSEYVRQEIIERYLHDCGREVEVRANSSRKAITACVRACERVKLFSELLEPGDLFQRDILQELNEDIVPKEQYRCVHELLIDCLQKHYGGEIRSCRSLELEAELKLHTPCKRRIIVPEDLNFYQLHRILQAAFDWRDYHLHHFLVPGKPARILRPDIWEDEGNGEDSTHVTVGEVFGEHRTVRYEYDFGDCWEHIIRLKHVIEDCTEPWPRCIQAVGDAPMEDCGGSEGYEWIMEILRNPEHPEYTETYEWVEDSIWKPLDVERINRRMGINWRRRVPQYF